MAKALLDILLADAQGLEGLLLHLRRVDPDGTAAQLAAVEHDVIGAGADVGLVGEDLIGVLLHGGGEGVVHGLEAALLLAPLEHGELRDPEEFEVVRIQQAQLAGGLAAQRAQGGEHHLVLGVGNDQYQVAVLGADPLQDGLLLGLGEELGVGGSDVPLVVVGVNVGEREFIKRKITVILRRR